MKNYWLGFVGVIVLSFAVLGWVGVRIYQQAPPYPRVVVTTEGRHGARGRRHRGRPERVAVDGRHGGRLDLGTRQLRRARTGRADWLHREAVFILDRWAGDASGRSYDALAGERQAALREPARSR